MVKNDGDSEKGKSFSIEEGGILLKTWGRRAAFLGLAVA